MRQAHYEEVDLAFHSANRARGLTKINLRMARAMRQRHKHLFGAPLLLAHIIGHRRHLLLISYPTIFNFQMFSGYDIIALQLEASMFRFCKIALVAFAFAVVLSVSESKAQNYEALFRNFSSNGLTFNERRYLQAALAFEGHYVGLLDGDWGRLSREAMHRYSLKEFGVPSEEWHTAVLAFGFYDRYNRDGWDMQYFPVLGMSVMLPQKALVTDPPTEHLLNYRHRDSSLAVSIGRHDQKTVASLHEFTFSAHSSSEKPYIVRKTDFAVTTATMSNGTKLYTRSNFINGAWSTVMVSAKPWDINTFQAVTSSIATGRSPALEITKDGKLIEVVRTTVALMNSTDQTKEKPKATEPEPESGRGGSSGSGFFVSSEGHVLTNAHVVEGCSAIFVDGAKASLIDSSDTFDLALLKTTMSDEKTVAVFSATSAMLNSDVTVVGFPYAGLLGGINVTRGAVSSLKGIRGDASQFQITAPVQSGNSGGPLLAADGEVIGVVVAKLDATKMAQNGGDVPQNVNFAIRGEIAKLFLAQNQVEPKLSMDNAELAPEQLAKLAAQFTSFIECK